MKFFVLLFSLLFFSVTNAQNTDSTYVYLEEKLQKASDNTSKIRAFIQLGDYFITRDLSKSKKYYYEADALTNETDLKTKAIILVKLGKVHMDKGEFAESFEYNFKAKDIYEELKDTSKIALSYIEMGKVYRFLDENDNAFIHYRKALHLATKIQDNKTVGRSYDYIGVLHRRLNRLDSAQVYYKKALAIFEKTKDSANLVAVNNNLAVLYTVVGDHKKAIDTRIKSAIFLKRNRLKRKLARNYTNLAYSHKSLKEYDIALRYLDSGVHIAKKEGYRYRLSKAAKLRSIIYEEMKDFKKAHQYFKIYKKYSDSIFNLRKQKKIKELELKNEFEVERRTLSLIANKREVEKKLYTLLFILILTFGGVIAFFTWRDFKARAERVKDEFEKEKLKKEVLSQKIKASESELRTLIADNTMRLEFVKQLSKQIKEDRDNSKELSVKNYTNSLLLKLQQQIATEEKSSFLQDKITEVNKGFEQNIIKLYPTLTKTEREVCSLLRLNLSIKEIASIRNASTDSIKALRYRIRKKMELPKSLELEGFIQNLSI